MLYNEAREYILSLNGRGIVPGLDTMRKLCKELGDPQDSIKTIHIAGTNGKGSVGAFICSVLIKSGYTVCRYASPAVEDNREIMQVNGEWITEEDYALCVEKAREAAEKIEEEGFMPTMFEVETAAAFVYFNMKKCDYAIVECGMGGRLDATNVISSPSCSVITSISMDHTVFLGDDLEKIASEKAGIIKKGVSVACAIQEDSVKKVIENVSRDLSAKCVFVKESEIQKCGLDGVEFIYDGLSLKTYLAGLYQADNAALAVEAVRLIDEPISENAIIEGIKAARWNCRFEVCGKDPNWIFDGAHNPDGAMRLSQTIEKYFKDKRVVYIFGVFKDKEYDKVAEITAKYAYKIFTVTPPTARGLDSKILAKTVEKYMDNVVATQSFDEAIKLCEREDCDAVICFGSLSFLSTIKNKKGF